MSVEEIKHELPPFCWSEVTAESIQETCGHLITQTNLLLDQIAQLGKEQLTFETCIAPLMSPPNYKTNYLLCETKFLQHCHHNEEIRKEAKEAAIQFSKARVSARMRKDIYEKVLEFSQTEAAKAMNEYQQFYLNSIILDFKRSGFGLSEENREKLIKLLERDTELCSKYSQNVTKTRAPLVLEANELEGVSETFIKFHTNTDTGKIDIPLKYPSISPILQSCVIEATRKKLSLYRGSAYNENLPLITEAVHVRKQIANLLGYPTYAGIYLFFLYSPIFLFF